MSKDLDKKKLKKPKVSKLPFRKQNKASVFVEKVFEPGENDSRNSMWNYTLLFLISFFLFGVLIFQLADLQVVQGEEMLVKSEDNQVKIKDISALRGVIFDRNGQKIVENTPSMDVYLTVEDYLDSVGYVDSEKLEETSDTLEGILGSDWKNESSDGEKEYLSIADKVYSVHESSSYFTEILIATDIENEQAIEIKANTENLPGIYIDDGSKRYYSIKESMSHLLGYTGEVSAEDLENLDYVDSTDVVGKTGIEKQYDQYLIGEDGQVAWEVDALGKIVSDDEYVLKEAVSGDNLYLTVDYKIQEKLYSILADAVDEYGATGAAGVIEDTETGEIISLVSYPSYDNNLFVGGISSKDYTKLLQDSSNPLLDRAIAAQVPPGSTFKTIVATSALDAGAVNTNTIYVSRTGYTFSSGAPFQEYHNHAYGAVNVVDALSVSSNIYFCELIRNWDMDALVPYLEKFGIGQYTGIDLPGEAPGRLPSPENKIELANTVSPWLDAVWYPEGDSCNSVIGQGITLVTPLQMSNWMAAIANGGTLNTPHLGLKLVGEDGEENVLEYDPIYTNIASQDAIEITQYGMWSAVNGDRRSIGTLSGLGIEVAAKTGTAEFGALNEDGEYEHTHAWVGGFFPYDNPKYSFSIFLEDGGESLNAVYVMRDLITWMVSEGYF